MLLLENIEKISNADLNIIGYIRLNKADLNIIRYIRLNKVDLNIIIFTVSIMYANCKFYCFK